MKTQLMQVDTTSGNRMYAEDIQYGANVYTEIFRGGMGITGATNSGIFKIFGIAVSGTSIQITKGALLLYYNGTSSSTIVDSDQIAVCRYNGNGVTINQGTAFNLYVGYNETRRVNEGGSNYIAYRDYFFQTTSFSRSKLTLSVPANLTIPELMKQYGWNYPMPKSFTFDLLEIPVDAEDILTEGSVGTSQLADQSVTSSKIAKGSVGTSQLDMNQVNGIFFDYTISNISQFGTVFNNILSRGSYKVRILAGEYNITQSYNLGNTSSNNKVDIYCDPGVKITLNSSPNNLYGFTVSNNGGEGQVNIYGGTFLNIWNSSGTISEESSVINGFNSISNALILNPLIINNVTGNLFAISNSSNINNCIAFISHSNYSQSQSNKLCSFFKNCTNLSNITIPNPDLSEGERKNIYIFFGCYNINNIYIYSYESINSITYFFNCYNIENVKIDIIGEFNSPGQNTLFFSSCNNVNSICINAENYAISTNVAPPIILFLSCNGINSCNITFKTVSTSNSFPMFTIMKRCLNVHNNYITIPSIIFTAMEDCRGVTHNSIINAIYVADNVYKGCYSSMNVYSEYKCANTANGGFNFTGQLNT